MLAQLQAVELEQAILRLESLATIAPLLLARARALTVEQYAALCKGNDYYGGLHADLPKIACDSLGIDIEALESERKRDALYPFHIRDIAAGRLPPPDPTRRIYRCTYNCESRPCAERDDDLMTVAEAVAHYQEHEREWEAANVQSDLENDEVQRGGVPLTREAVRERAAQYVDVSAPAARKAVVSAIASDLRRLDGRTDAPIALFIGQAQELLAEIAAGCALAEGLDALAPESFEEPEAPAGAVNDDQLARFLTRTPVKRRIRFQYEYRTAYRPAQRSRTRARSRPVDGAREGCIWRPERSDPPAGRCAHARPCTGGNDHRRPARVVRGDGHTPPSCAVSVMQSRTVPPHVAARELARRRGESTFTDPGTGETCCVACNRPRAYHPEPFPHASDAAYLAECDAQHAADAQRYRAGAPDPYWNTEHIIVLRSAFEPTGELAARPPWYRWDLCWKGRYYVEVPGAHFLIDAHPQGGGKWYLELAPRDACEFDLFGTPTLSRVYDAEHEREDDGESNDEAADDNTEDIDEEDTDALAFLA